MLAQVTTNLANLPASARVQRPGGGAKGAGQPTRNASSGVHLMRDLVVHDAAAERRHQLLRPTWTIHKSVYAVALIIAS